ncbi:MAG: AAA family ATPase [Desulfobacula sp.]|jgi:flagellar biosynthesis protein FlhG|nr:AAA family ATPase [Desulfobacula sp.]MBT6341402.1 AAA family ATPase [Desulfobacula sp.]
MARIITITSGEDGVGKTSVSLNLSLSLASKGFKVCLFDADYGLSNVNILTGIYPKKNLDSIISGQFSLNDIIIKNYHGIDIIPGSFGVKKLPDLTRTQTKNLVNAFLTLEDYDYFILDTSCNMSSQVLSFCMASHEIILVVNCGSTSVINAYSMLKKLSKLQYDLPVKVVINKAGSGRIAKKAYDQLKEIVNKFLPVKIAPLGIVASDKNVQAAVISQTPFFMLFPDTIASKCIRSITLKLLNKADQIPAIPLELFWDTCMSFLKKYHKPKKKQASQKTDVKKKKEQDLDIKKTLSHIESRLSILTKEVSGIKDSLKTYVAAPSTKGKDKASKPLNPVPEPVLEPVLEPVPAPVPEPVPAPMPIPEETSLDFESWLKNKEIHLDFESWLKKKYK